MRSFGRSLRHCARSGADLVRRVAAHLGLARDPPERDLARPDPDRDGADEVARLQRVVARLEGDLAAMRMQDPQTGLPNRTSLLREIRQRLDGTGGWDAFWVVAARFWQLEQLSHSLGGQAASAVMKEASARLRASVGPGASIARIGERELGLLLPASEPLTAAEIGRRLLAVIEDRFEVAGQGVYLHAVLGLANSSDAREEASDLLDKAALAADEALARDEKCVAFREETQEKVTTQLQLEADLQKALENGEFRLHFQPIVSALEGNIVGFEALLRWLHASGSMIPPDQFIPIAESAGYMAGIRDWVFKTGIEQSRRLRTVLADPVYLTMNLTPRDLNPEFCSAILNLVDEAGLAPEGIGVEITETAVVRDFRLAAQLIEQLSERGVRVLLDDFGTGYSSLSYLRQLPLHGVKIDRSFVHRMAFDARDFGLVRSIVSLVHYLGMECVAEGIETQEQLELIAMIDCNYWQGNLFSEPVPASAAEALARRRAPLVSAGSDLPGG